MAVPPGKKAPARKIVKGGTASTRKHRFESFNQRIAKLSIDPIRRPRHNDLQDDDLSTLQSFFKNALDRWKDLNLSENFTSFVREVDSICNNVAQILHYNQRIFEVLSRYICLRDALSLEPLLDLLSSFAHDLGVKFEGHFSKAITLVASIASQHADVEVIEWSFTCLSWLFKFLSRLLVPNLKPVFEIMAPFLGREPQKPHTIRFAAEAVSFLVRKAATVYAKNPKPLNIIVGAVRDDMMDLKKLEVGEARIQAYQQGLMTLLVESMRGIERRLYSKAEDIFRCLIDCTLLQGDETSADSLDIVYGVTIGLMHHCDAETFYPLAAIIAAKVQDLQPSASSTGIAAYGRLLFIVATVRKGTRIQDWTPLLSATTRLLELSDRPDHSAQSIVCKAMAMMFQSSPLDLLLPHFRSAMSILTDVHFSDQFLPFCNYFADLGRERFNELLLPYFLKFFETHWPEKEAELCVVTPKLVDETAHKKPSCSGASKSNMNSMFNKIQNDEEIIARCNSVLDLLEHVSVDSDLIHQILEKLRTLLDQQIEIHDTTSPMALFSFGNGLKALSYRSSRPSLAPQWSKLCLQARRFGRMPVYLEAMLALLSDETLPIGGADDLVEALMDNAHSNSHTLRQLSLQIIDALYKRQESQNAEIISIALSIEQSPLDLQSARSITMLSRKMATLYDSAFSHPWLCRIIPHFCFGMLTYKLSQAWEDAIMVLKEICRTKVGEDIVTSIAFDHLKAGSFVSDDPAAIDTVQKQQKTLTAFQCSNLLQIEELVERRRSEVIDASQYCRDKFDMDHHIVISHNDDAPAVALRVLVELPHIAEKRSRHLVPLFLSWAAAERQKTLPASPQTSRTASIDGTDVAVYKLRKHDQTAMLNLFGKFDNPKVLYRAPEVYNTLQDLLSNGSVEIQRSALRALLTWKSSSLQPYRENLFNMLDDARFRDEISTFLQVDDGISTVQEEHRPELMPVILRLLYGKAIAGTGSGSKVQIVKRKAILQALSRMDDVYILDFIRIATGPLRGINLVKDQETAEACLGQDLMSARKQAGLVNMMRNMLEILGERLAPFALTLGNALMYCLIQSVRSLRSQESSTAEQISNYASQVSLHKIIRQTGLQCLNLLFRYCPASSLQGYVPSIFHELLSPRIENLPVETAQAVSGTLQLFATWASSSDNAMHLVDHDPRTIKMIINCLKIPSAKDEVKVFVINDILLALVQGSKRPDARTRELDEQKSDRIKQADQKVKRAEAHDSLPMQDKSDEAVFEKVLKPYMYDILTGAEDLLRKSPGRELLASTIIFISTLAPMVEGSPHVKSLLEICVFLLDQPSHRVSPKSKGELLRVVLYFVPLVEDLQASDLFERIYFSVSSMFMFFNDRQNRATLAEVFMILADKDDELKLIAPLCSGLNAYSGTKVDEPDFDQRQTAYDGINEEHYRVFTPRQWRPILYNVLYYIRDEEDSFRLKASRSLQRFVEMNPILAENTSPTESNNPVKAILLPALRAGVSNPSELVRTEYLACMAHLVRRNPQWEDINDLCILLVNDDEEASFFGNVLHIQQHRRLRALRRLATEARDRGFQSANVAHFLTPLLEHFIFDKAEDEIAHNLRSESVDTVGALSACLEWTQFKATFQRYSGYIQSRPELQKTVIRLLGALIDSLAHTVETRENVQSDNTIEMEVDEQQHPRLQLGSLAATAPRNDKLAHTIKSKLLPNLEKYLHDKDESTVSLRIPVAISVVKLLKILPSREMREHLPPVLTDVCHILRSRSQESRDLTRKTLVDISALIGPDYFGFVLRELRSSLARGYQLHVLSYTVHSILVATSTIYKPGDIDYCLPQVVNIVLEDIFGNPGQEKDAEEYVSSMKEVKRSKSFDSMELVAKTVKVESLAELVKPLRVLLEEKLNLQMVRKIDELLRRIGAGLLRNEAIRDQRILVFCHELISEVYKKERPENRVPQEDQRAKRAQRILINYKAANKGSARGATSSYQYKIVRFALDILRTVLQRYDSLKTPENLAAFVPIVSDAILQSNEDIQISALRLLTSIIKVPLKSIHESASIYVTECVKIIKALSSTNVELAQAALKLVTAILRENTQFEIKETHLAYLLKRLIPDLDEPDKQGVAFNLLKSVMTRKIINPEIYEVLDRVAKIMVTNDTKAARDMARGAYIQFFLDYPQGKHRYNQQVKFLSLNLQDYGNEQGRKSVMETIHLLLNKVGGDLMQDIAGSFFLPLALALINDESENCREMARVLIKRIFELADAERMQSCLGLLRSWLNQNEETLLVRLSLEIHVFLFDVGSTHSQQEVPRLLARISQILKTEVKLSLAPSWEVLYFALEAMTKITQIFPVIAFASSTSGTWASVHQCLLFPHARVKLSSAKLLGLYFADFAKSNASNDETTLPLQGSRGLRLGEQDIVEITRSSIALLHITNRGEDITKEAASELAGQSVRNLVFLGKTMAQASMIWARAKHDTEASNGSESEDTDFAEEDKDQDDSFEGFDEEKPAKPALGHLILSASRILRRGSTSTRAQSLIPLRASLSLLDALTKAIPLPALMPHIFAIILPLHNFTDPSIAHPFSIDDAFTEGYKTLVENARLLKEVLEKKLGTTQYLNLMSKVREGVKARREGRRVKRRIDMVAAPQRAGQVKKRKGEKKREKRKERSHDQRGRRRGW